MIFSAAIENHKGFTARPDTWKHLFDRAFCIPKNLIYRLFIKDKMLSAFSTAMASIVNEEEDFVHKFFGKTPFNEIFFLLLSMDVPLYD